MLFLQIFLPLLNATFLNIFCPHSHTNLQTCSTKVFFVESIKIINELSNQSQCLYLQLDSLSKIKCQKLLFLFETNTYSVSGYKFKPRANSKQSSVKKELETLYKQWDTFYRFKYKYFSTKLQVDSKNIKRSGSWYYSSKI